MSDVHTALETVAVPGLHGAIHAEGPGVELRELPPRAFAQVGAWPATEAEARRVLGEVLGFAVPEGAGRVASDAGTACAALGTGTYGVVSDGPDLAARLAAAMPAETAAVTDLGHARTGIRLAGRRAADVLAKGLAIDVSETAFPPGSVLQSAIQHIGVLVIRSEADAFELYVGRAFALSFWEWLTDASLEYGYRVVAAG